MDTCQLSCSEHKNKSMGQFLTELKNAFPTPATFGGYHWEQNILKFISVSLFTDNKHIAIPGRFIKQLGEVEYILASLLSPNLCQFLY